MKFEKVRFSAPPDVPGNNSVNQDEHIENTEKEVFFEDVSVVDLKKQLVPWMRRMRLERTSVYAYEGSSRKQIGHFIVTDEGGRTQLVDRDGNQLSLFGAPRPTSGRGRPVRGRSGSVLRIEQWLSQKGAHHSTGTFDVFPYEDGDEEQTEQEAAIESSETAEAALFSTEETAIEERGVVEAENAEESSPKKIKGPRKPRRKKPVKAERKARLLERVREEYTKELRSFVDRAHSLRSVSKEEADKICSSFRSLARFLSSNRELRSRFVQDMRNDPAYSTMCVALSMFHMKDEERSEAVKLFPKLSLVQRSRPQSGVNLAQEKGDLLYMMSVLDELFDSKLHKDIYRSADAKNRIQTTNRTIYQYYNLLFQDMGRFEDFVLELVVAEPQRWLEIGPGNTYKEQDSLINTVRDLGSNITIVGADLLYARNSAASIDQLFGTNDLDSDWASKNLLVGASAQALPFQDESFDTVVSSWVFDKFNVNVDGETQAYRELARVLRPGGTARIFPMSAVTTSPVVSRYLKVEKSYEVIVGEKEEEREVMRSAILKRVESSNEDKQSLKKAIEDWTQSHMPLNNK